MIVATSVSLVDVLEVLGVIALIIFIFGGVMSYRRGS